MAKQSLLTNDRNTREQETMSWEQGTRASTGNTTADKQAQKQRYVYRAELMSNHRNYQAGGCGQISFDGNKQANRGDMRGTFLFYFWS